MHSLERCYAGEKVGKEPLPHYDACNDATAAILTAMTQARRDALETAKKAAEACRDAEWNEQRKLGATDVLYAIDGHLRALTQIPEEP
jgi:hypothetical protein